MTLHRIEHAVVTDTDDIPGRGGYSVVGISPRVAQIDRAFIAANFGISDYLHDPKTENRVFYSVFRMPSGCRAFVRRFARGTELRRNNTQRRLVIHTLLLDEEVWNQLYALPWLLLNARLHIQGASDPYRLSTDVSWIAEGASLPPLEWDSGDDATSQVAAKLTSRLSVVGNQLAGRTTEPRELIARVITALGSRSRLLLPQDPGYEWVTLLAWSMLPRHDRDELAWTQHDSANLSGVVFPLASSLTHDFDPALIRSATFAQELVRMNTESEDSWLDLQERTARDPLSVRRVRELDSWMKWREALLRLRENIKASEVQVVEYMTKLAGVVAANPGATWIDDEEVLHLVWANVRDAIANGKDPGIAAQAWGSRLRSSGLADVIFRAAPSERWLANAAEDVGAVALLRFFLFGGGEDPAAKATRTAIAEWLIGTRRYDAGSEDLAGQLAVLSFLLAADRSAALQPLLERLLSTPAGLDALLDYLRRRQKGGVDLVHAAAPIALGRAHPNTLAFFREVFVPRFEAHRVGSGLARDIATLLVDDPSAFRRFAGRLTPAVRSQLMALVCDWVERGSGAGLVLAREILSDQLKEDDGLETAGPLALALAQVGEPARTWFDVLLRMARPGEQRSDARATLAFLESLSRLDKRRLNLTGAIERLVPLLEDADLKSGEAIRALILLVRPTWAAGGHQFARAVRSLIDRAPLAAAWNEIVIAYALDHRHERPDDVSELVAAFWAWVDPTQIATMEPAAISLLGLVDPSGVQRLKAAWSSRLRSLPECPAADRLLEIVYQQHSYKEVIDLAVRDIDQGKATPGTLNRLEVALARQYGGKAAGMFGHEVEAYLGADGPALRLARLLDLFASDAILPSVRLVVQTQVLAKTLRAMRRRHWKELRPVVREESLLARGVVLRLAYAAGARADRRTVENFAEIWRTHRRHDALDALEAGRRARGPVQWLARTFGLAEPSLLAR